MRSPPFSTRPSPSPLPRRLTRWCCCARGSRPTCSISRGKCRFQPIRQGASARLAGAEAPSYEDNETTIAELKARLAKTIAFLKTLDGKKIDAAAEREIAFPLGPSITGRMKGDDYLNHFLLPNFYFHVTAAYAILRHNGVDIGKRDFLGSIPIKTT
jgi:uncharacterized protein